MSRLIQRLRFYIGKFFQTCLDTCLIPSSPLRGLRIPVGLHMQRDLRIFLGSSVGTIFDVGAHHGKTVAAFTKHFPDARVYAFEPIQENFQRLVTGSSNEKRVICNHVACGNYDGVFEIERSEDSERSSLKTQVMPSGQFETIQVLRIDSYSERVGIHCVDVLKIDTEGFEVEVLEGAGSMLSSGSVRAVVAECGFVRSDLDKTHFTVLDDYLTKSGFVFSGFYDFFRWGKNKRWMGFSNGLWLFKSSQDDASEI